ncbi:1-acyl-sn-glycerol-3-phosphate acyltransferase [Ramlibacter sp. AW1]|uniref:1-acyl-sn-glycerol-3-phosphate acyltransferase n=1 Tax=Ramlibacter aurantiacus TaxID=2801330 RepID=A0A936ZKI6_9BURK|nr:lysophospholipid acyltransferase family protein [Ramlibacter aurantiacus]MBL0418900.1 1-acyl-sn-glycerol-3-phosphate acyltransferase [Ramlibacter aurantiacus]
MAFHFFSPPPQAAGPLRAGPVAVIAWPLRLVLRAWLLVLLAWLGVLSLAWNAVAPLLRLVLPARWGRVVGRAGISGVYRVYWACARWSGLMRMDAQSLDVLRHEPGGLVIVANHPSMLDAMMIAARLPRSVCVMKASLMRNPFLAAGARLAGYVVNEDTRPMVRAAVECLREDAQLIIFPEGTRSLGPRRMHGFTRVVSVMARQANVPIQAVVIETDSPYLSKGWPLWRLPPLPIVFRARLGERFEPSADHDALTERMEAYFRRELGQ